MSELERAIAERAETDGQFAIAHALPQVAWQLKCLGTADANTQMEKQYADKYRRAQAEKMLDMFKRVRGRDATSVKELIDFIQVEKRSGRKSEGPVDPYAPEGKWR